MDAFMAETVAGLLGLMALLVGGLGVLFKRWMDQSDASQAAFQADVREELRSVRTALDRDYLLREPHMQLHAQLQDTLARMITRDNRNEAMLKNHEERISSLERKS